MKRILTLSSFPFLTIAFGFNEDIIQHQENDVLIINQESVSLGLERGYTNNIGYASTLFFSGFVMVQ